MNNDTLRALIASLHNPAAPQQHNMVRSVWEDGEVTLEKGKELFGQRNLHTMEFGLPGAIPKDWLPVQNATHARMYVNSEEDGLKIRAAIKAWLIAKLQAS